MWLVLVLFVLLVQGCSIGYFNSYRSSIIKSPSYNSKTGYKERSYTPANSDLLAKSIEVKSADNIPISKLEFDAVVDRMDFSKKKNEASIKNAIEGYMTSYREILADEGGDLPDAKEGADTEYFNIEEYNRRRPALNVLTVRSLYKEGVVPMTPEIMKSFIYYYKKHNWTQGVQVLENKKEFSDTFESKTDLYRLGNQKSDILKKENEPFFLTFGDGRADAKKKERVGNLSGTY